MLPLRTDISTCLQRTKPTTSLQTEPTKVNRIQIKLKQSSVFLEMFSTTLWLLSCLFMSYSFRTKIFIYFKSQASKNESKTWQGLYVPLKSNMFRCYIFLTTLDYTYFGYIQQHKVYLIWFSFESSGVFQLSILVVYISTFL